MKKSFEDAKADEANRPSSVAAGPKGLAFMGLRADLRKLEEKMDATAAAVNVASMAAGAAPSRGADGYTMHPPGIDNPAMAELEKLEEAMEDRFAMMQIQMDSMSEGRTACPCISGRCPCKCNSGSGGVREPPKRRTEEKPKEEDEFEKNDPWKKFNHRGDDDGDGGGDDGDGDGDAGADGFFIGTPNPHGRGGRGPKKAHEYEFGKLFEVKDAKSLPDYNGNDKGGLWRKKISDYLISKYPDMEKLLEWVEEKKEAVDHTLLRTYKKIDSRDSIALSMHLWGFLNISLVGDAWETFGNVVKGDGLEAWRRVLEKVTQKTKVEILDLEKSVMHLSLCATPEQVPMALGRWQTAV